MKNVVLSISIGDRTFTKEMKCKWNPSLHKELSNFASLDSDKELMSLVMEHLALEVVQPEFIQEASKELIPAWKN